MNAIEVAGLTKVYPGNILAVDNIDFTVATGEIFGFLGPNGAGKSTTITMLTTLTAPTSGTARVNGYDIIRQKNQVRRSLGYVSQDLAVDDSLTGYENLFLQAKFYGLPTEEARRRSAEVLSLVGLADRAGDLVETYSGGMRKRLDIAEGLLHRPKVLFLDEPTLGLDIQTRREIWAYITRLRAEVGITIFLTTHYMDEADRLCDRVAIIDRGALKAIDTPAALKSGLGGDVITLTLDGAEDAVHVVLERIGTLPEVSSVKPHEDEFVVVARDGESLLPRIFELTRDGAARIVRAGVNRPMLDDVYLAYTGRALRDEGGSREDAMRQRIAMRRARR